jgi:putative oxidoreductase
VHMTTTPAPRSSRLRTAVLWTVQIATALGFLGAAAGKFTADPQIMVTFHAIGLGDWFRYLIAALEVAGAVGLLVPRLAGVAALAFVGLMVGATVTQLAIHASLVMPLAMLVPSADIAWARRSSTSRLWAGFRRRAGITPAGSAIPGRRG